MSKKTGGPAFPHKKYDIGYAGMTLRDYFAAKAMQGIIAASNEDGGPYYFEEAVAENAYLMADAMIAEREKGDE